VFACGSAKCNMGTAVATRTNPNCPINCPTKPGLEAATARDIAQTLYSTGQLFLEIMKSKAFTSYVRLPIMGGFWLVCFLV
jgi:hypothetical protein